MFESSIFWIAFLALPEPLRSVAMIKGVMSCANIISNSVVAIFIPAENKADSHCKHKHKG